MILRNQHDVLANVDGVYCDAISSARISSICFRKIIPRISFDYGSLAYTFFHQVNRYKVPIYLIGSSKQKIEIAAKNIKEQFLHINIVGVHHGFISDGQTEQVATEIVASGAQFVLIGMGTPKQENMAKEIIQCAEGQQKTIHCFTCGGFLTQASQKLAYYPKWINRYHLRWAWRMFHEKHVIGRLLKEYPQFLYYFLKDRFMG